MSNAPNWANRTIWTGDNLDIMRGMNSQSVDLIYLDPPFNSKQDYAAPIGSDGAIISHAFMGGLKRAEITALEWRDMTEGKDGSILVHVSKSKTDQEGKTADYQLLKGKCAQTISALRAHRNDSENERVIGLEGWMVNKRIQLAVKFAGLDYQQITSHSGRIGLACELAERGAEITSIDNAGGWKSPQMVIHYSRKAQTELGAVAKYF